MCRSSLSGAGRRLIISLFVIDITMLAGVAVERLHAWYQSVPPAPPLAWLGAPMIQLFQGWQLSAAAIAAAWIVWQRPGPSRLAHLAMALLLALMMQQGWHLRLAPELMPYLEPLRAWIDLPGPIIAKIVLEVAQGMVLVGLLLLAGVLASGREERGLATIGLVVLGLLAIFGIGGDLLGTLTAGRFAGAKTAALLIEEGGELLAITFWLLMLDGWLRRAAETRDVPAIPLPRALPTAG